MRSYQLRRLHSPQRRTSAGGRSAILRTTNCLTGAVRQAAGWRAAAMYYYILLACAYRSVHWFGSLTRQWCLSSGTGLLSPFSYRRRGRLVPLVTCLSREMGMWGLLGGNRAEMSSTATYDMVRNRNTGRSEWRSLYEWVLLPALAAARYEGGGEREL